MLDPSSLSFLSPEAALARLHQMSHDEIVDLFARITSPGDVTEVIKAFAAADDTKLVSVLADLSSRKAVELITSVEAEVPWLKFLPVAAAAITKRAAELKWAYTREAGHLERVKSRGYTRRYPNGQIYWSENGGAQVVADALNRGFNSIIDKVGFPTAAEVLAAPSPFRTRGTYQEFEMGVVHYSPKVGTWVVPRESSDCYWRLGGSRSWLGFPIGPSGRSSYRQDMRPQVDGRPRAWHVQPFEGGAIYYWFSRKTPTLGFPQGPFPVRNSFTKYLDAAYGIGNWIPCGTENRVKVHRYTQIAHTQVFTVDRTRSGGCQDIEVCSSEAYGVHAVEPGISKLPDGGVFSLLGMPKADWDGVKQDFEDASVYLSPAKRFIVTSAATVEMISERDMADKLGLPLDHEQTIGRAGTDRIQFFENGAVVMRDGKLEILLRA